MRGKKVNKLIGKIFTRADRDRDAVAKREALKAHLASDAEALRLLELSEDAVFQATVGEVGQVLSKLS